MNLLQQALEAMEEMSHAIHEIHHAKNNPRWFTGGERAAMQHERLWIGKAAEIVRDKAGAITALRQAIEQGMVVVSGWRPIESAPTMRKATRDEKIVNPGIYEVPDHPEKHLEMVDHSELFRECLGFIQNKCDVRQGCIADYIALEEKLAKALQPEMIPQPDNSELAAKLRLVAKYHRTDRQEGDDAVIFAAADALETK